MARAVQLFDSDDSLAVQVATFLHRGYIHRRDDLAHLRALAREMAQP